MTNYNAISTDPETVPVIEKPDVTLEADTTDEAPEVLTALEEETEDTLEEVTPRKAKVKIEPSIKLNVRKEPSLEAEVIEQIRINAPLMVFDLFNGFYKVETRSGNIGYCKEEFVTFDI